MKNITINRQKKTAQLEKPISLTNGALVLLKHNGEIDRVFMVVSFRDNKNRYHGDSTEKYCSLLDLDSGYYAFEERASRKTTVRRVLNHVLPLGTNNYAYNMRIPESNYGTYDLEVKYSGEFTLDVSFN